MIRSLMCLAWLTFLSTNVSLGEENLSSRIDLWAGLAPGELTREIGTPLPQRPDEFPPATRIGQITAPQLEQFDPPADKKNGTAVLILPGGGYRYCVVDKEGSEIAQWLNQLGVTTFVLRYRTAREGDGDQAWQRPVQDAQRAIRWIRANADSLGLDPQKIGVIGFSAGGNAAAITATGSDRMESPQDEIDKEDRLPNFLMLIYPWRLVDDKTQELADSISIQANAPPTFLVHAHDDHSSSISSVAFYVALKKQRVPAELHIFESGGHGFGLRSVSRSNVDTWTKRAEDWLRNRKLVE